MVLILMMCCFLFALVIAGAYFYKNRGEFTAEITPMNLIETYNPAEASGRSGAVNVDDYTALSKNVDVGIKFENTEDGLDLGEIIARRYIGGEKKQEKTIKKTDEPKMFKKNAVSKIVFSGIDSEGINAVGDNKVRLFYKQKLTGVEMELTPKDIAAIPVTEEELAETLGLQEKKVTLLEPTLSKDDDKKAEITSEFINKGYYMFFDGAGRIEELNTGLDANADPKPKVTIIPATQGGDNSKFKIKIKGGDSGNDKFFAYTGTDVTLPREVGLLEDSTKSIVWELLEGSKPDYIRLSPTGTDHEGEFLMYDMRDTESNNHKLVVENIVNMTGLKYKCNYQSMDILLSENGILDTFTPCVNE